MKIQIVNAIITDEVNHCYQNKWLWKWALFLLWSLIDIYGKINKKSYGKINFKKFFVILLKVMAKWLKVIAKWLYVIAN